MVQLTLNIKDQSKINFLLELLKRMEFVDIVKTTETDDFEVDAFLTEIYQNREKSGSELSQKLDNLLKDKQLA